MYAIRQLLLSVLIFGWADFSLADDFSWKDFSDYFINEFCHWFVKIPFCKGTAEREPPETDTSDTSNADSSDTSNADTSDTSNTDTSDTDTSNTDTSDTDTSNTDTSDTSDSLASAIDIEAPENEDWIMKLDSKTNLIKMTPREGTKGTLTGGPFKVTQLVINSIEIGWIKNGTQEIKGRGFWSKKESSDANSSPIRAGELEFSIAVIGNTDNPAAEKFMQLVTEIRFPGDYDLVKSGVNFILKDMKRPDETYEYYPSTCYDTNTEQQLDNCITVLLSNLKNLYHVSVGQFQKMTSHCERITKQNLDVNMPPEGKRSSDKPDMKGKGLNINSK